MDNSNKKIITVSFVIVGFLAAAMLDVVLTAVSAHVGAVARFRALPIVHHGLPVAMGVLVFLILQLNGRIVIWADECVAEVRKVVWPSRKDTTAMTIVVCIMLVVAGVCFGLFDYVSGNLIKTIVKM